MPTTYIHYGSGHYDPSLFMPVHNVRYWTKPEGGLWASRCTATKGWRQWCERENFPYSKDIYFRFKMRNQNRIARIYSYSDLKCLPEAKSENVPRVFMEQVDGYYCIDFEKCLQDKLDGIELCHYGDEYDRKKKGKKSLYYPLFAWDCDCLLVLNPKAVIETEATR